MEKNTGKNPGADTISQRFEDLHFFDNREKLLHPSFDGDCLLRDRNFLPRLFQSPVHYISHTAAAQDLHMGDHNRFDGVAGEYLRQFCDISVNVRIQFRAEDNHDPVP